MLLELDQIIALSPLLLLLLGLGVTVAMDPYIRRDAQRRMLIITVLCLLLMFQNILDDYLAQGPPVPPWRTVTSICGYIIRPLILILFLDTARPGGYRKLWWSLAGVNAAVYMTALFSHICFWIDAENHYQRGPLSYTCLVFSAVLLAVLLLHTAMSYHAARKWDQLIPISTVLMIVGAVILDQYVWLPRQPVSFLIIAVIVGSVFFYIWLHLQFVREHERDLQAEQRIRIMVSQIQPHFLYNTIATFRALCKRDPDLAAEVAEKFGQYLRQNLDSLNTEGLIPFEKELEHTRLYADIEMVRFENLRVEYDIRDRDFALPPLTVQPMVENAIRHGVRARREGIVRIVTRPGEGCHEICIRDNGVGFDPRAAETAEGTHIGIRNVRERVEKLCSGTLTLESRIGEGTTVTIRIPERKAAE